MNLNSIDALLERHSLKKTQLRRQILGVLATAEESLTQADLISKLGRDVDRVSVYRNLTQLKDSGLVHEVEINSYVFCSHECEAHGHLLLFCPKCRKHKEIKDHNRISEFSEALREFKFFGERQPIFIKGLCRKCQ